MCIFQILIQSVIVLQFRLVLIKNLSVYIIVTLSLPSVSSNLLFSDSFPNLFEVLHVHFPRHFYIWNISTKIAAC
jgi:hypothetical protein